MSMQIQKLTIVLRTYLETILPDFSTTSPTLYDSATYVRPGTSVGLVVISERRAALTEGDIEASDSIGIDWTLRCRDISS